MPRSLEAARRRLCRRSRSCLALVAALAGLAALAGPAAADATKEFRLTTLSSRADTVTAGDALVRIDVPRTVPLHQVTVTLNGADVTGAFVPERTSRALTGLVAGLRLGSNTLEARANGRGHGRPAAARLTLVNHPKTGPVFSGPHQQPFICETQSFVMPVIGGNLGAPIDADCSINTRVDYVYRATDGTLRPLPAARPSDVATTTTITGTTVPYIVRVETGTINRAIYQIAMLHDPFTEAAPSPWARPAGWNRRFLYTFGGGCPGGWYRQGASLAAYGPNNDGAVLDDVFLSRGYATASSSLNVFGNNCSDLTAAETMMMVKERMIETLGVPRFTVGWGCSGGSYQQHQIADNYPGLLDGILPGCSFPEVGFGTIHTITDARLLDNYFTGVSPGLFTQEQQRLVSGFGKWESIPTLSGGARRIDPRVFCGVLPIALRYDPVTNPTGARCDFYDHSVNVFGRDPATGFARRPLDNVGIQYGLAVLNAGQITKAQFLDLNERIGGFDADANFVPERTVADLQATRAAYQTGRLTNGGGGLRETPTIDHRAYTDLRPNGDIHMRFQGFSTRDRLIKANGHADNHVMLVEDFTYGYYSSRSPLLREALTQMDRWLVNLSEDTSDDPEAVKVVRAKPADLVDGCVAPGTGERINERQFYGGPGTSRCNDYFPSFPAPRNVAGGPVANDIIKCQLKPLDPADYAVSWTPEEWARLEAIFPEGVCDWSKPGVEQQGLTGTWIHFN